MPMRTDYRSFAIKLAQQAGNIMRTNFTLGMERKIKSDNTPLTITDTTVNQLVIDTIKKNYPDHSVIAEEGSIPGNNKDYVWVCDPIDGTIPFSHGIPAFTFSLALTKNGKSLLGVVYDPIADRLFVAEKGKGATLNDKAIHVSNVNRLKGSVIYIAWYKSAVLDLRNIYGLLEDNSIRFTSYNSSVHAAMLVACGEFPVALQGGKYPWDAAAVKIIVEEAGGKVTDLAGKDQLYDKEIYGFVASNGLVHEEMLAIIQKENR